ncbi:MAG: hypothetical protein JWQ90_2662 [Hydrocarboniphaga sp.]|uniref:hypothetical protein n=1 Tax=Hydrocarboniphaga sp. TaxID=2033016 RepID=UPI00260F0098|nr:hypothetical protein [Hydrocarboniphaga sp.]MDB5970212.1 hypothetical protein [Hydrocarboniphaga sp.]
MKKALQVIGIIFIALLLILGCFIGYAAYTGTRLDASSKEYVDAAIPAIVSTWSESELTSRSAPQLMQGSTPEQFQKLFHWLSSLGPMKKYCGSKGDSSVFVSPQQGKTVSARYTACAQFEKGDATINVVLLQNKDKAWEIAGFHVDSPALIPQ